MNLPLELLNALDEWKQGKGSLATRLAAALEGAARRGDLLPGTKLPPERVMATELRLARTTVSTAYASLEKRGIVERRQGRGTHIRTAGWEAVGIRAAELTTSLQRNLLFRRLGDRQSNAIDLLGSAPSPHRVIREKVDAALGAIDIDVLLADHGYFPLGFPPLREAIAARYTQRGLATTEAEILITSGAQQAITLLAGFYLDPGAIVVVEDPTFPGAVDAFRTAGGRIVTVPVLESPQSIEVLAATISQVSTRVLYLIPGFHNPTGTVLADRARGDLVRLAGMHRIPIIADEALADLSLAGEPPPPLAAYSRAAHVVSIGSLSKLVWGGLRVGWIRAAEDVIARLGPLKAVADLGSSIIGQAIAVGILSELEDLRELRRGELAGRLALAEELLQRDLPNWAWKRPAGGLSIWARLPFGSSTELAQFAARAGVLIAPGSVMSPTGRFDDFVRLPFDHEPAVLAEGFRRLTSAWKVYADELLSSASGEATVLV